MVNFSTHLLEEAWRKKRKKLEMGRLAAVEKVLEILDRLSESVSFQEAYLFGSILKAGVFRESSDLDIGFVGLSDQDFFRSMAFLSREAGKEVDVVQIEKHPWGEKIKKEGLKWKRKNSRS